MEADGVRWAEGEQPADPSLAIPLHPDLARPAYLLMQCLKKVGKVNEARRMEDYLVAVQQQFGSDKQLLRWLEPAMQVGRCAAAPEKRPFWMVDEAEARPPASTAVKTKLEEAIEAERAGEAPGSPTFAAASAAGSAQAPPGQAASLATWT